MREGMPNMHNLEKESSEDSKTLLEKIRTSNTAKFIRNYIALSMLTAVGMGAYEMHKGSKDTNETSKMTEHYNAQASLTPEQAQQLQENRAYIEQHFGSHLLPYLQYLEKQNHEVKPSEKPVFQNFENLGIRTEDLQKLWQDGKTYPKGWINGAVDTIKVQLPEEVSGPSYGSAEQEAEGWYGGGAQRNAEGKNLIIFSGMEGYPQNQRLSSLDWLFSHEIGHLKDGRYNRDVPFAERIAFLRKAHERLQSPDHFQSPTWGYGNMENVQDPEQRAFYLTTEFLGSLFEYYFSFPEILQKDSPEDFELVDAWIKKGDPDFDVFEAKKLRDEIKRECGERTENFDETPEKQ